MLDFNPSISALQAIQTAMNVKAHNIANTYSEDFQPADVTFKERPNMGGVDAVIFQPETSNTNIIPTQNYLYTSNIDLVKEMTDTMALKNQFLANVKMLEKMDTLNESIIEFMG